MSAGDVSDIVHGVKVKPASDRLSNIMKFFHNNIPNDRSVSVGISGGLMSPYLYNFYFHDWQAPCLTYYQAGTPGFGQTAFLFTLEQAQGDKILVLDDSLNRWQAYVLGQQKLGNYLLYKEEQWPAMGITAKIFIKKGINLIERVRSN